MCGIAGFFDLSRGLPKGALEHTVSEMSMALTHRGPDGAGVWADEAGGIALGHRRLSVIDLSPSGAQPMASADSRFIITYNGEIYNADELRQSLADAGVSSLRGHCDTEILLEACALWGVEETLKRATGMFAFAIWDRRERRLTLARDRLGIKPLYWGRMGRSILFASELKALTVHPQFKGTLDRDALSSYFRYGYVPAPASIYQNVFKLEPGHFIEFDLYGKSREKVYWDLHQLAKEGAAKAAPPLDEKEALDALEAQLREAVRCRLVSDVPLGAFLSGGIDSSTVVALMQAENSNPVKTFTIGFDEADYNEAGHARDVATHLGTDHTELTVRPEDALGVIPNLPSLYDEPFADASAIPTFLVSELARSDVTVSLSGDGGDELFAGYDRYRIAGVARLGFAPAPLRRALGAVIGALPPQAWDFLARPIPDRLRPPALGDKLAKLSRVLKSDDDDAVYRTLCALWAEPDALVLGANEIKGAPFDVTLAADFPHFMSRMQYLDTMTYLPDDILTKVDRASMAVGLEARVPLLDHRVVEHAWGLHPSMKRRGGVSKWALREVLCRHVPRKMIDRPKMGFGVPVGDWLRGPLRDWAENLLDPDRLRREGVLDAAMVERHWQEHLSGRRNWSYRLWAVLMFQAWKEKWLP